MQLKYKKAYGLRLYICTNEPEICSFMTNDIRGGKMSIQKCDKCRDGYLVVKHGRDSDFFLGCTNYKPNGTGCNKMINKKAFYDQMGYEMEETGAMHVEESTKRQQFTKQQITAEASGNQSAVNRKAKDDYVEIILADIQPVTYGNFELNNLIFTVVKALQNISRVRYYGVTVLVEVLKGTDSKKIFESKLDKLPEFGALQDMPYETIKSVIEWMITEHFILKTKGKYPVLHSTYEGLHYSEVMTEGKLKRLKRYLEEEVCNRA